MTEQHNTYLVLLKDRNPETDAASMESAAKSLAEVLQAQDLTEEVSNYNLDLFELGLLLFDCTAKVAELFKSQTDIVEDVTQADTSEQIQEYLVNRVLTAEQKEEIQKRSSHNTYFLLLKDRSGNVDEKTGQAKEAVKALLIDNKLWNESEISNFEYHYPLGLIAIQCSDEVIELIKAQASLIGDVTKIESEEQSQEYLFTKVMNPEDVERFLHDINDPSF